MDDATQKRLIATLSAAVAFLVATQLSERFMQQPEVRGIQDDVKEGLLQAMFSLLSTVVASLAIRRLLGSR
jgi:hypothetical protein